MRAPGQEHFRALIHLLQYLRDNTNLGLTFYHNIEDAPIYKLIKEAGEKDVKKLFGMHDSSWQDYPVTGESTASYVLFYQGGTVDYSTYVPSPVAMSSAEAECNSGTVAGMAISHIRMLQNEINGEEADILYNCPVIMCCDDPSAVTIVNSDKDIRSLRHCKRRILYIHRLQL